MTHQRCKKIYFVFLFPAFFLLFAFGFNFPVNDKKLNADGTGERYEGFKNFTKNPKEFNFDFISAKILYPENPPGTIQQYSFALFPTTFLPDLQVIIAERKSGYYMSPLKKAYNRSLDVFSWDSGFVTRNNIALESLQCIILLSSDEVIDGNIVPVLFFYNRNLPDKITGYEFCFYSSFDTTTSIIISDDNEKEIFKDKKINFPRKIEMVFTWKPKTVKAGDYYLVIDSQTSGESKKLSKHYTYRFHNIMDIIQ
jgi:hypothetical protein